MTYEFKKTKPDLYFGYLEVEENNMKANVAAFEKVFLDFLYFRIDTYSIDLVVEKLKEGRGDLDLEKLFSYAVEYPVSVKCRLGYLLDLAGADTNVLYKQIKSRRDYSKLTNQSSKFDAKWRIYYEDRFSL